MSPVVRKFALMAHVIASGGWIGALAVFLAHAIAVLGTDDVPTLRALSIAMGLTAWFVILPLSVASLFTGIVQAAGTTWGLLRHYWVLFKLLLTLVATAVLLLKLAPISALAAAAREAAFSSGDLVDLRMSLMVHAAAGLLVLLTVAALGIFKPRGMTRYGLRMNGGDAPNAATPRWVKRFGVAMIVLMLALVGMLLGGGHGPGAHLQTRPASGPP
jgi:putative copper export protein